jgi:hypothetical protein
LEAEEARKNSIKQRAEEKDRLLAELYARRQKENDLKKVQTEFELKLRLDKVRKILLQRGSQACSSGHTRESSLKRRMDMI